MTERPPSDEAVEGEGPDGDAPRLQNTTEREALPLPLPGSEPPQDPAVDPPTSAEPEPEPEPDPEPAPPDEEPSAPEPPPLPDPEPAPPDEEPSAPEPAALPDPEPAPAADDHGTAAFEPAGAAPPYAPAASVSDLAEPDAGPRPELLVGVAFAGGLALALILRRLRS